MIIKSKSRVNKSFYSLYNYLDKDKEAELNTYNMYCQAKNRDEVVKEFKENSNNIDKSQGKNYLYHEILSLEKDLNLSQERKREVLRDLTNKYIELRAKDHLVFSAIHTDKEHTHCHLMISANKIESSKREWLTKKQLEQIKRELEEYKNERYPELETNMYQKPPRERIIEKLNKILVNSQDIKKELKEQGLNVEKRGNTYSVNLNGNKNFRLKSLGVEIDTRFKQILEEQNVDFKGKDRRAKEPDKKDYANEQRKKWEDKLGKVFQKAKVNSFQRANEKMDRNQDKNSSQNSFSSEDKPQKENKGSSIDDKIKSREQELAQESKENSLERE
jgi:hypothetical protein